MTVGRVLVQNEIELGARTIQHLHSLGYLE